MFIRDEKTCYTTIPWSFNARECFFASIATRKQAKKNNKVKTVIEINVKVHNLGTYYIDQLRVKECSDSKSGENSCKRKTMLYMCVCVQHQEMNWDKPVW